MQHRRNISNKNDKKKLYNLPHRELSTKASPHFCQVGEDVIKLYEML